MPPAAISPAGRAPEFADNADRLANLEALNEFLFAATGQRPRDDLLRAFDDQGVPAGPINTIEQAFEDPQTVARELVLTMRRDGIRIPGVRAPFRFSDCDIDSEIPAPKLGSDDADWL